jgi:UPF0755 protein
VLRDNLTPREVLDALVAGVRERSVAVTLPEGKHMLEFFQLLEQAGVAKAAELEVLARDPKVLTAHAIAGDTVDGYLFPDTYQFVVPTPPAKVLERLINAHRKAWNAAAREHGKALARLKDRLKWSDRDVLILASIVEKEAVEAVERPRIAQVFINRLTSPSFKPKKLETDPTIRYGCLVPVSKSQACKDWLAMCPPDKPGCERLHRAQLVDADNPYNSYQHEGLPPGPICNPGKSSIAAAFDPDGSDYFFFVAKDARHHAFSKTVAEHERAVEQYKQWRAARLSRRRLVAEPPSAGPGPRPRDTRRGARYGVGGSQLTFAVTVSWRSGLLGHCKTTVVVAAEPSCSMNSLSPSPIGSRWLYVPTPGRVYSSSGPVFL